MLVVVNLKIGNKIELLDCSLPKKNAVIPIGINAQKLSLQSIAIYKKMQKLNLNTIISISCLVKVLLKNNKITINFIVYV